MFQKTFIFATTGFSKFNDGGEDMLDLTCVLQAIPDTPFTLGVALPTEYELARVVGGTEVTIDALEGEQ